MSSFVRGLIRVYASTTLMHILCLICVVYMRFKSEVPDLVGPSLQKLFHS